MPDASVKLGRDGRRMSPASLANLVPGAGAGTAPGERRAFTHGGYATVAKERMDAKEREIFDALAIDAPLRDGDGDLPSEDTVAVHLLAQCLCRLEDVKANIRDYGWADQKTGDPRPVVELEMRLRKEADGRLDALGMTPTARARLGLDIAKTVDLATAMSHPDPEERRRLQAQAGYVEEGDGA